MMKKNIVFKVIALSMVLLPLVGTFGQTSNEGLLYVSTATEFSTEADMHNKTTGEFYNDGEAFIYKDFDNRGIVDFYAETGITRFIGTSAQEISGDKLSTFYNVFFKNSSAAAPFHLSGDMQVFGVADFNQGVVDVDNYQGSFLFNTDATHQNTSDNSHVDGSVDKYGNTNFVYPIGDKGYYRFAGIAAPSSTSAMYSAKYFYEDPNTLYNRDSREAHIALIDAQEYWTIAPLTSEEDLLITLSWRDVTTPQAILEAPIAEQLHIARWDEEAGIWIDEGGVVDVDAQTVTTNVNSFGVFTLARVASESDDSFELVVHNAITPNGDGINDYFVIDFDENPNVTKVHVQIYNRWGVKVFETDNYGTNGDVFDGYSNGRLTINENERLPTGTYFYVLNYQYNNEGTFEQNKQAGYLYLNGN